MNTDKTNFYGTNVAGFNLRVVCNRHTKVFARLKWGQALPLASCSDAAGYLTVIVA
jgi:hypothetical protein